MFDKPSSVAEHGLPEIPTNHLPQSQLIQEQYSDPEISALLQWAVDETDISQEPVCNFIKNGVLMRKWRPQMRGWSITR